MTYYFSWLDRDLKLYLPLKFGRPVSKAIIGALKNTYLAGQLHTIFLRDPLLLQNFKNIDTTKVENLAALGCFFNRSLDFRNWYQT